MGFTCSLCGGNIVVQGGGEAVCEGCGLAYSMESLRSMMGNGASAAPAASAPRRPSAVVQHHINQAASYMAERQRDQAIAVLKKALEVEPDNADAWEMKIVAHDWLVNQAVGAFCVYYKAGAQDPAARARALAFFDKNFGVTMSDVDGDMKRRYNNYSSSSQGLEATIQLAEILPELASRFVCLYLEVRKSADRKCHINGPFSGYDAEIIAIKDMKKLFPVLTDEALNAIDEHLAGMLPTIEQYIDDRWEYGPGATARRMRPKISNTRKQIAELLAARTKQRVADYWTEHAQEKEELKKELMQLRKEKSELDDALNSLPILKEIEAAKEKVQEIIAARKALSLFKGAQRKELAAKALKAQEDVEALCAERNRQQEEINKKLYAKEEREKSIMNKLDHPF